MAIPVRKTAPATASAGVNFLDMEFYTGQTFIPDGKYILVFGVQYYSGKDGKAPQRLGTMVDFYPLDSPAEEHKLSKFYSFGTKADKSFAPNTETGKGIVAIPGAAAANLQSGTNWYLLLDSMFNSGLPKGYLSGDLGMLDGVHVNVQNVDEPAERASFAQNSTAEVQQQQGPRVASKIPIVTEILEGGAPWDGGGGFPTAASAKAPVKAAPAKAPVKALAKAPAKPAPAAEPPQDEAVLEAAKDGVSKVLQKNLKGCRALSLRNGTFKAVKETAGEDAANDVINTFFEGDTEQLDLILQEFGFTLDAEGNVVTA